MTSSPFLPLKKHLLQRRKTRRRARGRWTCTAASCCRVNANYARLINAIRRSTGVQSDRTSANREPCVTGSSAGCWNTGGQLQHAVGRVRVLVATLLERGGREHFVDQMSVGTAALFFISVPASFPSASCRALFCKSLSSASPASPCPCLSIAREFCRRRLGWQRWVVSSLRPTNDRE